jgi:predicted nucleic acid-binding protein
MLVVADSSTLNVIISIGQASILPRLFHEVVIPIEVARELSRPRTPQIVKDFIAAPPPWLVVREPLHMQSIPTLHAGELAAISLAIEIHANYLLIDERDGRRAAIRENLAVIGTIGVLERAAITQLLDLPDTLRKLPPDFTARLDPALIKNALERDLIRKAKPAS